MRADVRALSAVPHVDAAELGVWPRVAEKEARIPLVDDAVAVVVDVVAELGRAGPHADIVVIAVCRQWEVVRVVVRRACALQIRPVAVFIHRVPARFGRTRMDRGIHLVAVVGTGQSIVVKILGRAGHIPAGAVLIDAVPAALEAPWPNAGVMVIAVRRGGEPIAVEISHAAVTEAGVFTRAVLVDAIAGRLASSRTAKRVRIVAVAKCENGIIGFVAVPIGVHAEAIAPVAVLINLVAGQVVFALAEGAVRIVAVVDKQDHVAVAVDLVTAHVTIDALVVLAVLADGVVVAALGRLERMNLLGQAPLRIGQTRGREIVPVIEAIGRLGARLLGDAAAARGRDVAAVPKRVGVQITFGGVGDGADLEGARVAVPDGAVGDEHDLVPGIGDGVQEHRPRARREKRPTDVEPVRPNRAAIDAHGPLRDQPLARPAICRGESLDRDAPPIRHQRRRGRRLHPARPAGP